jgi:hypothetical protein
LCQCTLAKLHESLAIGLVLAHCCLAGCCHKTIRCGSACTRSTPSLARTHCPQTPHQHVCAQGMSAAGVCVTFPTTPPWGPVTFPWGCRASCGRRCSEVGPSLCNTHIFPCTALIIAVDWLLHGHLTSMCSSHHMLSVQPPLACHHPVCCHAICGLAADLLLLWCAACAALPL